MTTNGNEEISMKEIKVRFDLLSESEQKRLAEVYGAQPLTGYSAHRIEYVRVLTPRESWFFSGSNFLSPGFLTQAVYKLEGVLSPMRFNRALHALDARAAGLRTAYCDMGDRVLAIVFQRREHMDGVHCQFLRTEDDAAINAAIWKAAESEIRQPFDIMRGLSVRFAIFHTGEQEYAVIVTGAQIVMERLDVRGLLCAALDLPNPVSISAPPVMRNAQMEYKLYGYWKRLLVSPPPLAKLPRQRDNGDAHGYRQRTYRTVIPAGLFSTLWTDAKGSRMMLASFLATAWGFLLQAESGVKDICICLAVPPKGGQTSEAQNPFQMVPIRQKTTEDAVIGDFVAGQFQQFLISCPYACFDWETFGELLGRKGKPFDHLLDFCDFLTEAVPYTAQPAAPEGHLVARHSCDPQGMKLSLYFRYEGGEASIMFIYDASCFVPDAGEKLAKAYLAVVRQMVTDRYDNYANFQKRLAARISGNPVSSIKYSKDGNAKLQNAISSIRLLQSETIGTTQFFIKESRLETYFEGDILRDMDTDMLFLVEGMVSRNIEDGDGWYFPVDVAGAGAWLNETVLLQKRKAVIAAKVVSEKATILVIPKDAFRHLAVAHPALWENIASYALAQMETYLRLWARS